MIILTLMECNYVILIIYMYMYMYIIVCMCVHVCVRAAYWIRSNPRSNLYQTTDHQSLHRINFVYSTDFFLGLPLMAAFPDFRPKLSTSLDHSVWFYGDIKDGDWYLHCQELEHSHEGRTLNSVR